MTQVGDPYRVLQVDPEAEPEVIRAAYRSLALKYHPDKGGHHQERMAALNEAWSLLRDPAQRARLDRERSNGGASTSVFSASQPPRPTAAAQPTPEAAPAQARTWTQAPGPRPGPSGGAVLDFGRFAGWTLSDVARQDPDYLEWLVRTPIGRRFAAPVRALLHPDGEWSEPGDRPASRRFRRR